LLHNFARVTNSPAIIAKKSSGDIIPRPCNRSTELTPAKLVQEKRLFRAAYSHIFFQSIPLESSPTHVQERAYNPSTSQERGPKIIYTIIAKTTHNHKLREGANTRQRSSAYLYPQPEPRQNHTGQQVSLHRKPTLVTFTGIRKILSSSSKVRHLPSTNGSTKSIQNTTPARNSDRKSAAQDLPLPNSKFQYYYSCADGEIPPRQDLRSNCDGTKKSNEHF